MLPRRSPRWYRNAVRTVPAAIAAALSLIACRGVPSEPVPLAAVAPQAPRARSERGASPAGAKDRDAVAIAIERESWVYAGPSATSAKLGYLRAGERVKRATEATGKEGCAAGWFEVEPRGYVCFDAAWTTDPEQPIAKLYERPPRRDGMPYLYVRARYPTPRFYARFPSVEEQHALEPKLDTWLAK
jgi:hypothetical protein